MVKKTKPVSRKALVSSLDSRVPVQTRSQREIDDDKYIEYLEAQLGYKKGKKSKRAEEDEDGLDGVYYFARLLSCVLTASFRIA